MHYILICICPFFALGSAVLADTPDAGQKRLIDCGHGMFIHSGANTFNEVEWSHGKPPASSFNPTRLDCDQWIRITKASAPPSLNLITVSDMSGKPLNPEKRTNIIHLPAAGPPLRIGKK